MYGVLRALGLGGKGSGKLEEIDEVWDANKGEEYAGPELSFDEKRALQREIDSNFAEWEDLAESMGLAGRAAIGLYSL